jgi:hypothetical protein
MKKKKKNLSHKENPIESALFQRYRDKFLQLSHKNNYADIPQTLEPREAMYVYR